MLQKGPKDCYHYLRNAGHCHVIGLCEASINRHFEFDAMLVYFAIDLLELWTLVIWILNLDIWMLAWLTVGNFATFKTF